MAKDTQARGIGNQALDSIGYTTALAPTADTIANRLALSDRVALASNMNMPSQILIELQDGETKYVSMDKLLMMAQAGNLNPTIRFFAYPLWIEDVTSIVPSADFNISDNNESGKISTIAQINLANPRTIEKNRFYKLISNDVIPERYATNARLGEVVSPSVANPNMTSFYTTAPLRDSGYTTNVKLVAYKMARVIITGGAVKPMAADDGTKVGPQIELMGLVGSTISDMSSLDTYGQVIRLIGCVDTEVSDLRVRNGVNNATTGNLTYGVVDFGSEGTRFIGGDFRNTRHAFTSDSFDYPSGDQTGLNAWKYGRTRGTIVSGLNGRGNSNAIMDTHDEADGVIASDCLSFSSYVGSSSGGSGAQMRGRNVIFNNVNSVGCQQGLAIKTFSNGLAVGCSHVDTVQQCLTFSSGNSAVPQDVEGTVEGGVYVGKNVTYPSLVTAQLSAAALTAGKKIRARILGGATIGVRGTSSILINVIRLYDNVTLRLDANIDMREVTGGTFSQGLLYVTDTSVVTGKLTIRLGSANVSQLLYAATLPCQAKIDLHVEMEGDVDFSNANLYKHLGFDPNDWPNVRITGYKRIAGIRTPFSSITYSPVAGDTIRGLACGDPSVYVRLQPTADLTGSTNRVLIDATRFARGQTAMLHNDTNFVVQIDNYGTIGPNGTMTVGNPLGSTTMRWLTSSSDSGQIVVTASFTTAGRDRNARYALSGTGTNNVAFRPNAQVGERIVFDLIGTSAWTFSVGTGGTLTSKQNYTKISLQYGRVVGECVANVGGSAAVWRLSGDLSA